MYCKFLSVAAVVGFTKVLIEALCIVNVVFKLTR